MDTKYHLFACSLAALTLASTAADAETVSLWSISYSGQAQRDALARSKALFEERHPEDTLEITFRAVDPHKTALRVAAGASEGPDIYISWAGPGLGGEYVRAGLSLPVEKYYEQYGWEEKLSPVSLGSVSIYDEHKHGIPLRFSGEAIYYNTELFKRAGIEALPQTYEELVAAAEKLKEAGIPAFTFGGSVNWHLMRLLDNIIETKCGAEKHDALKSMQVKWTSEACATEAFDDLGTWAQNYTLQPFMGIDNIQSSNLFVADRAAMMIETDSFVSVLEGAGKENVGLLQFPTGTDRLYGFSEYMYISTKSKNPDLAAEYIDMFLSDDFQTETAGVFGSIPVNKHVRTPDDAPELTKAWATIMEGTDTTFVNGDQAFPLDVTTEYFRVMNGVAAGEMTGAEATATLQQFIDQR